MNGNKQPGFDGFIITIITEAGNVEVGQTYAAILERWEHQQEVLVFTEEEAGLFFTQYREKKFPGQDLLLMLCWYVEDGSLGNLSASAYPNGSDVSDASQLVFSVLYGSREDQAAADTYQLLRLQHHKTTVKIDHGLIFDLVKYLHQRLKVINLAEHDQQVIEEEGKAVRHYCLLLEQGDVAMRVRAARMLAAYASPDATEPLIAALDDPEPAVRAAAAGSLAVLRVHDAVPMLVDTLHDDEAIAWEAAQAALVSFGEASLPGLKDLLLRPDWEMQWRAASTLQQMGRLAEATLLDVIAEGDWHAAWVAVQALEGSESAEVRAALARWRGKPADWDEDLGF